MIIDYEYSSYNFRGFDLGNHFCEWMFNNNYDKHPYFEYNYDLFPSRSQQVEFITAYMDEFKRAKKETNLRKDSTRNDSGSKDDLDEWATKNLNVENLIVESNYFALASHLYWAHWSVCQAAMCKIKFEYLVRS